MPHVELPQAEFKVVMLGDTNAGKTSLVLRFAEGYYRDAPRSSTVGAFFITKRVQTCNGITCKIQIWDTAGQSQFRPMAPMYYRTAAAAIVCYDVSSEESFQVMRGWLAELHRNIPAGSIVIAIAATKCDLLQDDQDSHHGNGNDDHDNVYTSNTKLPVIPISDAEDLAQAVGAIFVDTSAKDNFRVADLFQRVAERVLRYKSSNNVLPVTNGACVNEHGEIINRNGNSISINSTLNQNSTTPEGATNTNTHSSSSTKNNANIHSSSTPSFIEKAGTNLYTMYNGTINKGSNRHVVACTTPTTTINDTTDYDPTNNYKNNNNNRHSNYKTNTPLPKPYILPTRGTNLNRRFQQSAKIEEEIIDTSSQQPQPQLQLPIISPANNNKNTNLITSPALDNDLPQSNVSLHNNTSPSSSVLCGAPLMCGMFGGSVNDKNNASPSDSGGNTGDGSDACLLS